MARGFSWRFPRRAGSGATADETKSGPYGLVAFPGATDARWTHATYGDMAREGFMRNAVAHRCVRMVAEAAASVPWLLQDGVTEETGHPLLALLDRPNQRQSGTELLEALYGHLLVGGNAFLERVDIRDGLAELHLLRPDRCRLAIDAKGWPLAIEHGVGRTARSVPLDGDGVPRGLHMRLFHPLDDVAGFSPMQAALGALDVHNAAQRWNKALLDNSARPSGALVYAPKDGGNLSPDQFDRLKAELEQGYAGATRAGRPLLLEGGLDWKAMALSPRDMDFMEARNGASREIALALGVPPMLLGLPGDNTYANYQEANRAFYRLTVLPLARRTAHSFGQWLGPLWGEGLRLVADPDGIEGLAAEREALWSRVGSATFLTEDEKREAVGYAPLASS